LSFSNAINTPNFTFGYLYHTSLFNTLNKNQARAINLFCKNIKAETMVHCGLKNDIANENKQAIKLLNVGDEND